jgi:tetratricopeptide (TPR) repeat protein
MTAGFALVGAGAGLAAATAAIGNTWVRTAWAVAGGVVGLVGGTMADRFRQRRQAKAEAERQRDSVLGPIASEQAREDSVFDLLLASSEVTPLWGRKADLAWLEKWRDDPGGHPVAVVTGPAGVGKTRLVTHFAARRPESWVTGWLNRGHGADAVAVVQAAGDPALILVDDADERTDTAAVLEYLAASRRGAPPVRVVLISRAADLTAGLERTLPDRYRSVLAGAWERPLGPFGSADDHARWFGEAVRAYARALGTPPPDTPTGISARSFNPEEPILTLQAQALLMVLESRRARPMSPVTGVRPFDEVAAMLFQQEEHRWQKSAKLPEWGLTDLTGPNQSMAIAALILSSPGDQAQAVAALRRVPDLADASAERLGNIARWAAGLYPADPTWPIRIKPDMLAEWFVVTQLSQVPELAGPLGELDFRHAAAMLMLLARASDHTPAAVELFANLVSANPVSLAEASIAAALTATTGRRKLDGVLARSILQATWSDDLLRPVEDQPVTGLPRTQAAIAQARVGLVRTEGDAASLAAALTALESHLAKLGRYEDAVAVAEESVDLYRRLARRGRGRRPDLGKALTSLGKRLADLGSFKEAADAAEESAGVYRSLARRDPAFEPGLAEALASLGKRHADLGRYKEARAATEESVALYRSLAKDNLALQPGLAGALTSLGVRLAQLGRWDEALAAAEESVGLYRQLAQDNPALYADLAKGLNSLAERLGKLGRYFEALPAAKESVGLYRLLARDNEAFKPDLAWALTSLGISLDILNHHKEARAAAEESVALYRTLARDTPALQPDLARALNSLGIYLAKLSRYHEALTAAQEAVGLFRPLAQQNPAHQAFFGTSLINLTNHLERLGHHQKALASAEECVGVWRNLARKDPDYTRTYQRELEHLNRVRMQLR